jgi:hypothetical protein
MAWFLSKERFSLFQVEGLGREWQVKKRGQVQRSGVLNAPSYNPPSAARAGSELRTDWVQQTLVPKRQQWLFPSSTGPFRLVQLPCSVTTRPVPPPQTPTHPLEKELMRKKMSKFPES